MRLGDGWNEPITSNLALDSEFIHPPSTKEKPL